MWKRSCASGPALTTHNFFQNVHPAKKQTLVRVMSALGQKRTFAVQNGMSASPPKADMCSAQAHVRFVPKADIGGTQKKSATTQT
jgi:hypothetical protein